jgi:hypothetical protein
MIIKKFNKYARRSFSISVIMRNKKKKVVIDTNKGDEAVDCLALRLINEIRQVFNNLLSIIQCLLPTFFVPPHM